MKLNLPFLNNPSTTLSSWGSILRSLNLLEQKEIAFKDYDPEVVATGAMTLTAISSGYARTLTIGNICFCGFYIECTFGGVAAPLLVSTLPTTCSGMHSFTGTVVGGATVASVTGLISENSNKVGIRLYNAGNYPLGAGRIVLGGFFEVA